VLSLDIVGMFTEDQLIDLAIGSKTSDDVRAAVYIAMGWAVTTQNAAEILIDAMFEEGSDELLIAALRGAAGHVHDREVRETMEMVAECCADDRVGRFASEILGWSR
jgi:hypothetical protein